MLIVVLVNTLVIESCPARNLVALVAHIYFLLIQSTMVAGVPLHLEPSGVSGDAPRVESFGATSH